MNESLREQIIGTACHLFASHGFYRTTTAQIARAVGVSQPYLYHFFANKECLYLAAIDQAKLRILHVINSAEPQTELLKAFFSIQHQDDIELILHSSAVAETTIREAVAPAIYAIYTAMKDHFEKAGIENASNVTLGCIGKCLLNSLTYKNCYT